MSLSEAIVTWAGPTRSARGTGSFQPTEAAERSIGRLQRTSTVVSPDNGCMNGMTTLPPLLTTAAASTMPGGPTSSTFQPSRPSIMRDTGAPRTMTRSVATSPTRVALMS